VNFLSRENELFATPSASMLDNETYDLMEQLLVENKSLWRIKNNYKDDSSMDDETKQVWHRIQKDKEDLVRILKERVKARL
jgi:hypothetical protein